MRIIALDFDGTLCQHQFPHIGAPRWDIINQAITAKREGAKLILWTCREGKYLDAAVGACKEWGIELDAVNDNLPDTKSVYGTNCRKVMATEYWDDLAVRV